MSRLLLLLAALLACAALSGATNQDGLLKSSNTRFGRKLKQTDAVCCLFGKNNNPPACSQQNVNSPDARNTSQTGLVNVNGVYVNLGCIQVVADVQACVTIGSVLGSGDCVRPAVQLTPQAQALVDQATQAVKQVAADNNIPLLSTDALAPATGAVTGATQPGTTGAAAQQGPAGGAAAATQPVTNAAGGAAQQVGGTVGGIVGGVTGGNPGGGGGPVGGVTGPVTGAVSGLVR